MPDDYGYLCCEHCPAPDEIGPNELHDFNDHEEPCADCEEADA